ncbi:hypothetical protein [Corynebacterium sp. TAE3-ERU16]|nr:hypothetical protein [Corynebacterium sp. TAE3-ERU16]MBV7292157.1 hypothetical protein [Corynebacterium sp. TAE3-ERU16]
MPEPYPGELSGDVVRGTRSREDGVSPEQVAEDPGIHPVTLNKWFR